MHRKADSWVLEEKKKHWLGLVSGNNLISDFYLLPFYMQGYFMTVALRENKYPVDEAQINLVKFWYIG